VPYLDVHACLSVRCHMDGAGVGIMLIINDVVEGSRFHMKNTRKTSNIPRVCLPHVIPTLVKTNSNLMWILCFNDT